ncbi:DUF6612 family protein [Peribacillus asahii]|uniref:Uncharacterized protein n=1 Tax=Peribacillus asahii TaxID=228899 RepID=A0A3Q9RK00_9BACI|nr:DUF6612 family protein [Peribacillus asahii]AZV40919.1 hypothetical protein BAOM_0212 [Peribacillus asahii]USK85353.1 hypothetical protein LIT35_01025 [Peribacillus asahii]
MKFKKLLAIPFLALFTVLGACGQEAAPVSDAGKSKTDEKPQASEESLTVEEVFEKTIAASRDLKSVSVKMDNNQTITSSNNPEPMDVKSTIEMDVIQNPIALYQEMTIEVPGEESVKSETYFTDKGFYMFEPTENKWMKLPEEMSAEILKATKEQGDPAAELKKMQSYVEDFKFEQDDSSYFLTLNASGDKFNSLVQEEMSKSLGQDLGVALENIDINDVNFKYTIDKKSFNLTAMAINMTIKTVEGEEEVTMKQTTNAIFSNYNGVDEIAIPEDVMKSAEEIQLPQ